VDTEYPADIIAMNILYLAVVAVPPTPAQRLEQCGCIG
jgi:hypothetical protein